MIAERFHFHRRNQNSEESIAEFIVELRRRLSTHCAFGDSFNDALRDCLVCGLQNESIQKRLLSEEDLTIKKALELAQGMEAADKNAQALKRTESPLLQTLPGQKNNCSNSSQSKMWAY